MSVKEFEVLVTKDLTKKRKVWSDAKLEVQLTSRLARILQSCDMVSGSKGSCLFSGILDPSKFNAIINSMDEEIRLGSYLVTIQAECSARHPEVYSSTAAPASLDVPSLISRQHVDLSNNLLNQRQQHESSLNKYRHEFGLSQQLVLRKSSTFSNQQFNSVPATSLNRIPIAYGKLLRSVTVPNVFRDPSSYFSKFVIAVVEEILLKVKESLISSEHRIISILQTGPPASSKSATGSMGAVSMAKMRFPSLLPTAPSLAPRTNELPPKMPSLVGFDAKLRKVSIFCCAEVEVVIAPNADESSSHSSNEKRSYNSALTFNNKQHSKGCINPYEKPVESDCNALHEVEPKNEIDDAHSLPDNISTAAAKMYLKLPSSYRDFSSKDGGNALAKGDVWVLWLQDSSALEDFSCENLLDHMARYSLSAAAGSLGSGSCMPSPFEPEQLKNLQNQYFDCRRNLKYPLPWFKGVCWRQTWIVRSLWHSVSERNMLAVVPLDGSVTAPAWLPRSRGGAAVKCNAIRLTNDLNAFNVLDLLLTGRSMPTLKPLSEPGSSTTSAISAVNNSFRSDTTGIDSSVTALMTKLLASEVFTAGILSTENRLPLHPLGVNGPLRMPTSSAAKPVAAVTSGQAGKSNVASALPQFSANVVAAVMAHISAEFGLNFDQRTVLLQVAQWFCDGKELIAGLPRSMESSGDAIVSERNILLVHGVFGSGKSHLIVAICAFIKEMSDLLPPAKPAQSSRLPQPLSGPLLPPKPLRVLISSNTNVAVDRVMVALSHFAASQGTSSSDTGTGCSASHPKLSIARVGKASKIDSALRRYLVTMSDNRAAALQEVNSLIQRGDPDPLLREMRDRTNSPSFVESQRRMVAEADVIGVTCASAGSSFLTGIVCPIVILDEASQVTEPTSLLAIACARASKLILVGDPKQLPPTTAMANSQSLVGVEDPSYVAMAASNSSKSADNSVVKAGETSPECRVNSGSYERPLFDRMTSLGYGSVMLRTQYRCHPTIADICSNMFYDGRLINGVSVLQREALIPGLSPVSVIEINAKESRVQDSFENFTEAKVIVGLLEWALQRAGPKSSFGVICVYKPQVALIAKLANASAVLCKALQGAADVESQLKISTVDAFQGQEKDVIILATTRSQSNAFVSNSARTNVAFSRARRHLIVVGHSLLLSGATVWRTVKAAAATAGCSATCVADLVDRCQENSFETAHGDAFAEAELRWRSDPPQRPAAIKSPPLPSMVADLDALPAGVLDEAATATIDLPPPILLTAQSRAIDDLSDEPTQVSLSTIDLIPSLPTSLSPSVALKKRHGPVNTGDDSGGRCDGRVDGQFAGFNCEGKRIRM